MGRFLWPTHYNDSITKEFFYHANQIIWWSNDSWLLWSQDFLGDVKKNVRLRVLTFVTETVNKKLIHINDMADELFDRLDNYNYAVTINTNRPAQYVTTKELAQFE